MKPLSESTIQQQITSYLSARGIFYFSIPNEGIMTVLKIFKIPDKICYAIMNFFKKMGLTPGMPDIAVIPEKGTLIFFEVKNEKGKVSPNQKIIHAALERLGFDVYVVRSVEEVGRVLDEYEW